MTRRAATLKRPFFPDLVGPTRRRPEAVTERSGHRWARGGGRCGPPDPHRGSDPGPPTDLLVRLTGANLDPTVRRIDVMAVSVVAGVGFTVSLLIGELSFAEASPHSDHVKAAVLIGSLTAAAMGGALLMWRTTLHVRRQAQELEELPTV